MTLDEYRAAVRRHVTDFFKFYAPGAAVAFEDSDSSVRVVVRDSARVLWHTFKHSRYSSDEDLFYEAELMHDRWFS